MTVSPRQQALYLLAMARNFAPRDLDRIVTQLGSLEALLEAPELELQKLDLRGGQTARLLAARQASDPAKEIALLAAEGIQLVGFGEPAYPELLEECADAPLLLFCKGHVEQMRNHGIAIVGSRKCSERGAELARSFARELAELSVPVVSGMALGIDGAAHEGALSAGGPSVAVVGSGVDVIYPSQHHQLYADLCARGLVCSEYPPGTEPLKEHFPQRNRIVSGMSRGVLVIDAPMGSGALITARTAIEQGREVFAVPGPVNSHFVKGCHHLIKTGQAKLVENVEDILTEFGTSRAALRKERYASGDLFETQEAAADGVSADAAVSSGKVGGQTAAVPPLPAGPRKDPLPAAERRVLEALSYEGTHINEVVRRLNLTTSECIAHLTLLEIRGLISSASGGYYVRL
jgi:DNA processing protein